MRIDFGAGIFLKEQGFTSADDVRPWLDLLLENKDVVNRLDSAVAYDECEEWLGQLNVGSKYGFRVSTKLPGGIHPTQVSSEENILAQARYSLSKVGVKQVSTILRLRSVNTMTIARPMMILLKIADPTETNSNY